LREGLVIVLGRIVESDSNFSEEKGLEDRGGAGSWAASLPVSGTPQEGLPVLVMSELNV
jgi:hypothetical protein